VTARLWQHRLSTHRREEAPRERREPLALGRFAPEQARRRPLHAARMHEPDLDRQRPTLEQFLAHVRTALVNRYYTPNTVDNYCGRLSTFFAVCGADPHQVDRADVENYFYDVLDRTTLKNAADTLGVLRTVFDRLCHRDLTARLSTISRIAGIDLHYQYGQPRAYVAQDQWAAPASHGQCCGGPSQRRDVTPSDDVSDTQMLTPEQFETALAACTRPRDRALLLLPYTTGIRLAELVALDWTDVDVEQQTMLVKPGLGRTPRRITLPRRAMAALIEHRQTDMDHQTGPIFRSLRTGSARLTARAVQKTLRSIGQRAQLDVRLCPRLIRRTAMKRFIDAGHCRLALEELLGLAPDSVARLVRQFRKNAPSAPPRTDDPTLAPHARTVGLAYNTQMLAGLDEFIPQGEAYMKITLAKLSITERGDSVRAVATSNHTTWSGQERSDVLKSGNAADIARFRLSERMLPCYANHPVPTLRETTLKPRP